jgi:ATP-dependent protease HslVU (ClpYQ) peptidase subunit
MTVIAAIKANGRVYMAGDRGASDMDTGLILNLSKSKIHKVGDYVFGFAGTMDGQRIAYSFDPPKPHPDEDLDFFMHTTFLKALRAYYDEWWFPTSDESEFSMLIAYKDKLYEHNSSDMSITEYTNHFMAVGSGEQYAYGYLSAVAGTKNPEQAIEGAVKAAIKFSPSCAGTVDILTT